MEIIRPYDKKIHENSENVYIEAYRSKPSPEMAKYPRPVVVVFPGGAYVMTSDREAEPVADCYKAAGYEVFVVRYTVAPNCHEINPLLDAAQSIVYIRRHAEEFHIDPNKIAVCGFSAGGHLAAYISTCYNDERVLSALGIEKDEARPNATILCYPVISGSYHPHFDSIKYLLSKEEPSEEEIERVTLENRVTENTPPTFIWSTANDNGVPVENSLVYATSLSAHKVKFELHIFPKGLHGLSTSRPNVCWDENARDILVLPYISRWVGLSIKWLDDTFFDGTYSR